MIKQTTQSDIPFGTKADTLLRLAAIGFHVPPLRCYTVPQWRAASSEVINDIQTTFTSSALLAVRSSALAEDGVSCSHAGAFHSELNVNALETDKLQEAIEAVVASMTGGDDQFFVQPMVLDVEMSGVIMTRTLDDGSPYYTINYDDTSGRTDTVTSGTGAHKMVYIYHGAKDDDFDSPRLRSVVLFARSLEAVFHSIPLDIEFALDKSETIYLLQVRQISAQSNWECEMTGRVSERFQFVEQYIKASMAPRYGLFGEKTTFGLMPDWNPAEMIGVHPKPLAFSIYRELITRRTWSTARAKMGYRNLPPTELMVSISGRPYIDVRNSFNSFLPDGLPDSICKRLVNAWLDRLDSNPNYHDKIEFEVVHTIADLDFKQSFAERYPNLLSATEFAEYALRLRDLTRNALRPQGTLSKALNRVSELRSKQELQRTQVDDYNVFDSGLRLKQLLEECIRLGTIPFAVIARHGFIAESLLRSAVRQGAISQERVEEFKRSIRTISGELTKDFSEVCRGRMAKEDFIAAYGHLRPGTYDILSQPYKNRPDIFANATAPEIPELHSKFRFTSTEKKTFGLLLEENGLHTAPQQFLEYAAAAVAGREYAKFIFTRHVSEILDTLTLWGERFALCPEDVAMLPIGFIVDSTFSPLPIGEKEYFLEHIEEQKILYELGRSFKLSYIIRSARDVYIVPQHRNTPNFITNKRLQADIVHLDSSSSSDTDLSGKIICIESADPGYDWIFTRDIGGLITRYGGANSHMAIRCAEYSLPAAIGCGDMLFEKIKKSSACLLDCAEKNITAVNSA